MITVGWFYRGEHDAKELANAIQKAEQRFQNLRTRQESDRQDLEDKIASDRIKAEQSLGKLLKENSKLRAEADARVDVSFLIYSKLCESPEECTVLRGGTEANPQSQGLYEITNLDIYAVLRDVTDAIQEHNLQVEQVNQQIRECKK